MSDLEQRLRDALHAVDPEVSDADAAWATLAAELQPREHELVGGDLAGGRVADDEAVVVDLAGSARSPRRRRLALAVAVAACVALATLVATVSIRQSADGPATSPSDVLPRFVLDDPPAAMVLNAAYDNLPGGMSDRYVVGLRSTGSDLESVQIEAWPGSESVVAPSGLTTVNGHAAVFNPDLPDGSNLIWQDGEVTYQLIASGPRMKDRAFVVLLAESVKRAAPAVPGEPPAFTLASVPSGLVVTYAGTELALMPIGGYSVNYRVDPSGDTTAEVEIEVSPGHPTAEALAYVYGLEPVTAGRRSVFVGRGGYLARVVADENQIRVVFAAGDAVVTVHAYNLPRADVLAAVARLRVVSDREWRRRLGDKLDPGVASNGASATTAIVPSVPFASDASTAFSGAASPTLPDTTAADTTAPDASTAATAVPESTAATAIVVPTTTADVCTATRYAAGPNSFMVRTCPADNTVRLTAGAAKVATGYVVTVNQSGPPVVEMTFTGPTTYHCVVSMHGGAASNVCD